jgi:hypothetical protein
MNEEWWQTEDRKTLANLVRWAKEIQRIQEIVDAINPYRKDLQKLVVWEPGDTYCAVCNTSGTLILWYVELASGRIVGSRHGVPIPPPKGSEEERAWLYNIWEEDPTKYMSLFGVIKDLKTDDHSTLMPNHESYINHKYAQSVVNKWLREEKEKLSKNHYYEACYKSDRVYTNYALEA